MVNDKLNIIFSKQIQFDLSVNDRLLGLPIDQKVSNKCIAIIHEAVELQRLTNWKWWKDGKEFDLKEAKEELIDIMFFVVSAAINMGITPEDFFQEYLNKWLVNVDRQMNRKRGVLQVGESNKKEDVLQTVTPIGTNEEDIEKLKEYNRH